MEVLLLDTTEKEGEDNILYHYVHASHDVGCFSTSSPNSKINTTRWLDLRGVLAAAVGATTSLCGEPLQCARFGDGGTNDCGGIVGFVNIYEVLYALVFCADIPEAIVQYYTRSSCDLLLSLLGYPEAKLGQWRQRDGCSISSATLTTQLDSIFRGIFSRIQHDLSFDSSLQFAFNGRVPAVNYPLETMAKLAVLDVPFTDTESTQKYATIGRCIFYRKQLAFSTMRCDFLRILFQWLLDGRFNPTGSVTKSSENKSTKAPTSIDTYELHDFRFTRHCIYPKRHALLIICHGNLQLAFLVERNLQLEDSDGAATWAKHFADVVNQHCAESIASFCDDNLERYLKRTQELRQQRTEEVLAQFWDRLHRDAMQMTHDRPFLWYSVALDRLRGVIIGDQLSPSQQTEQQNESQQHAHGAILALFVRYLVASQQSTRCMHDTIPETSPELPSGIPPVKLDVDDPNALFLREKSTSEAGADISTGDAHIFPQLDGTCEEYNKKGRALRQTAERVMVWSQPFWIITTFYETLEVFSISDDALPLGLLEHEMKRLCAFGGAELEEPAK